MTIRGPVLAVCLVLTAGPIALSAHPTATTSVTIMASGANHLDVGIDTDPDALLTKLTVFAGVELPSGVSAPSVRDARIAALHATLENLLGVTVGQTAVPLQFVGIEDLGRPGVSRVVVRLAATLPHDSRQFTFRSSLVYGSYPLIVRHAGVQGESIDWLEGPQVSPSHPTISGSGPPEAPLASFERDFFLGFTHILPNGLDHILFVLGLFLLSTRLRSVLAQVSAFTVAHSITLGLTLYGWVALPASVIEPLIAVSIVYVACENLWTSNLTPWRLGLVFAFGLLHGMGFAEALARLHLARADFLTTLVSFNVGVEAGQLTIVGLAALAVWSFGMAKADYRRLVVRPGSLAIALIGAFWVIERLRN
jgi:hypothetical protein